jgi:site-specific DNA-methyltransferase (adenine-specific)
MTSSQAAAAMDIHPPTLPEVRPASTASTAARRFRIEGEVEIHWIAKKFFPTSSDYGASALAKSIERQGAIEPVTLYEGMLLDGRIRDQASREQGKPREAINFEDTPQGIVAAAQGKEAMDRAALEYAIAKNVERTHYTQGQLAMIGARMPHREEGRPKKHPSAGEFLRSETQIAELVGVSTGLLSNAKRVLREGTPDQIREADAGGPIEPIVMEIKREEKRRKRFDELSKHKTLLIPDRCLNVFAEDCIDPERRIKDETVDLGIFDPPFGIKETEFDKHYNRNQELIIEGYREAPDDYGNWTLRWLAEAKRVTRPDGSMFVFIGHSRLRELLNASYELGLHVINHIIWKYNFGVSTKNKFVTSHYHVLWLSKSEKAKPTFNLNCRFGSDEKDERGGSLLYQDLQDVFTINREYAPETRKNQNKLPEEILRKLVMYASNPGDTIADFFLGNFTTAYVALKLGRNVCGYEINEHAFKHHMERLKQVEFGCDLDREALR